MVLIFGSFIYGKERPYRREQGLWLFVLKMPPQCRHER